MSTWLDFIASLLGIVGYATAASANSPRMFASASLRTLSTGQTTQQAVRRGRSD
jgi:hypothetical protein